MVVVGQKTAARFGCSLGTVQGWLRGVEKRPRKEAFAAYAAEKQKNAGFFDALDTADKAYWFGMLVADGSLVHGDHAVRLSLKRSDAAHVARFAALFDVPVTPVEVFRKTTGKTYFWAQARVNCTHLVRQLMAEVRPEEEKAA